MIINIKVKPNSLKDKVVKISEGEYEISVREPAEDNRVNICVVNLLAKKFGIDFRKIRIKNPKSRKKVVEVVE